MPLAAKDRMVVSLVKKVTHNIGGQKHNAPAEMTVAPQLRNKACLPLCAAILQM